MKIFTGEKRLSYIKQHSISHIFSFPIEEHIQVYEYERGEWIIQEGILPEHLFFVVEGSAKIYVTHQNGKVSLLSFVNQFDFIGEMELLHEVYYSKGIQTSTKTICFAIPFWDCKEKLLADAKFLRHLSIFLSNKATRMAAKYSQTLAYPLDNRLAEFILQTADNDMYKEKHVTVCDFLGVSYRHLLFVLAQFCENGYLEKEGRGYRILERDALVDLANALKNE